ncbi:hypothetical protein GCM10028777_31930 [Angustibacter speluncae]
MTQQPAAGAPATWAAPQPGTAHEPPTHATQTHEPARRRGAGAWTGLVLLGALACLLAWTFTPLAARLLQLPDLGVRGLVFGVTPTSFALGTGPFLNILLLGVAVAALVTRRALGTLAAVGVALLLGCLGHVAAPLLYSAPARPVPVVVGLLLTALVVLPLAALVGLLARTPWGRLVVVAAVLAPTLLVVLQQTVFLLGGARVTTRVPSLVVLGLVVALVVAVAVGGGRARPAESAARLGVALVLLLVGGALLPLLSSGLLALFAGTLPRDLGGGMRVPTGPGLDQLLVPFQAMRVTWPAWVGGLVAGALAGGGVLLARRARNPRT